VLERASATAMLNDLFPLFLGDPAQMPDHWGVDAAATASETERARIVLDYVAGMTDRFAIAEWRRLCG
jgi:dGTPase